MIHCVDLSIAIFSFPIFSNCFEKRSADTSFCGWTCILVFRVNLFICRHKTYAFRHALSSSAFVKPSITGRVCRKSLDNKMRASPMLFISPQIFQCTIKRFNCFFVSHCPFIPYDKFRCLENFAHSIIFSNIAVCKFSGNFSDECAVRVPSKSIAAILESRIAAI